MKRIFVLLFVVGCGTGGTTPVMEVLTSDVPVEDETSIEDVDLETINELFPDDEGVDCSGDGCTTAVNPCIEQVCDEDGSCVERCVCVEHCFGDESCPTSDLCAPAACVVTRGSGECRETICVAQPIDCDDNNDCTADGCDPRVGVCKHTKIPDCGPCVSDGDCNDGNRCTIDTCKGSKCIHTADPCEDYDETTKDLCITTVGCIHLKSKCSSDADCGPAPLCVALQCDPFTGDCMATPVTCDDGLECTDDYCDPISGCIHRLKGQACTSDVACADEDPCTEDICDSVSLCCVHNRVAGCRPCTVSYECNDGDPCTDDICDEATKTCIHPFNNAPCDDGNPCTTLDLCINGVCTGGSFVICDDGDVCTADYCDPMKGCVHANLSECTPCTSDADCFRGDPCTRDRCWAGHCLHIPVSCDDQNPCTDDYCDKDGICAHVANNAPCEDNDLCTLSDRCEGGVCIPGTSKPSCFDNNVCTSDTCISWAGCVNSPVEGECSDLDPCTINDHCELGRCVAQGIMDCDDHNSCTGDACVPGKGCSYTPIYCDDKDPCTVDTCDTVKGCMYEPMDCDDNDSCTTDLCVNGTCEHEPLSCDDGDACTIDTCDKINGCVHTSMVSFACNDDNPCTRDSCDPVKGCTYTLDPTICDDNNVCTDDFCDPSTGCYHKPNNNNCDDGNMCTEPDLCVNGSCQSGAPVTCPDDNNECTVEVCDPAIGCISVNRTGPCTGSDPVCFHDYTCQDGKCIGKPVNCDDGNECTIDGCGPNGCYHVYADDGAPCNGKCGKCKAGKCDPNAVNCDDGLKCTTQKCVPSKGCVYDLVSNCWCHEDWECDVHDPSRYTCCKWKFGDIHTICHNCP